MTDDHNIGDIRVLLVEDDPDFGPVLGNALEKAGIEVTLVPGAEEALEILRTQWKAEELSETANTDGPDIVFADIRLGGMSGVDLLRDIRLEKPDFPVILLTGYDDKESTIEAVRLGAQDYVLKSDTDIHETPDRIKKHVRLHRLHMRNLALMSELLLAEDKERLRLSEELHNSVSQTLAASHWRLGLLTQKRLPKKIADELSEISDLVGDTLKHTLSMIRSLYPPVLHEMGIAKALRTLVTETAHNYGLLSDFQDDGHVKPLDERVQSFLFRVTRELIMNVVKHAAAKRIGLSVSRNGKYVCIIVDDDGCGFDTDWDPLKHRTPGGLGLISIRERLETLGGRLKIESTPGTGTRATVCLPLNGRETPRLPNRREDNECVCERQDDRAEEEVENHDC